MAMNFTKPTAIIYLPEKPLHRISESTALPNHLLHNKEKIQVGPSCPRIVTEGKRRVAQIVLYPTEDPPESTPVPLELLPEMLHFPEIPTTPDILKIQDFEDIIPAGDEAKLVLLYQHPEELSKDERQRLEEAYGVLQPPQSLPLTEDDFDRINPLFGLPTWSQMRYASALPSAARCQPMAELLKAYGVLCPIIADKYYNIRSKEIDPSVFINGAKIPDYLPVVSLKHPEAIPLRSCATYVGFGPLNDVVLSSTGHCNYVAQTHALITVDDISKALKVYDLAPYGTRINGILYINAKIGKLIEHDEKDAPEVIAEESDEDEVPCNCSVENFFNGLDKAKSSYGKLQHGGVVEFGCLKFVLHMLAIFDEY